MIYIMEHNYNNMWLIFCVAFLCRACTSAEVPSVELNDGTKMPGVGFGTWLGFQKDVEHHLNLLLKDGPNGQLLEPVKDDSVQKAVETAIDTGYRLIDTAAIYRTEDQVGQAINNKISEGVVKREDLFVITKLWNDRHARSAVVPALRESLSHLKLEYLDLFLIHWPMAQHLNGTDQDIDYLETWQGMIDARDQGLTKSIGVCNFNQEMLERLIKETGVKPAVLQIEVNLNLQQPSLREFCRQHGIAVIGYTPFGSLFGSRAVPSAPPPRADDPVLLALGQKYGKSVAQIVLRYLVHLGVVPIPKTVNKSRVVENFGIFDFQLTDDEQATLKAFDNGYRVIDIPFWRDSPYYPFEKNSTTTSH